MLRNPSDFERYLPMKNRWVGTTTNLIRRSYHLLKRDENSDPVVKLRLYIGKEVAHRFQWKKGTKLVLEVSKSDPRVIRLIAGSLSEREAYTLSGQPNQQFYQLNVTWNKFIPGSKEAMMKITDYTPGEGGIIIYLH